MIFEFMFGMLCGMILAELLRYWFKKDEFNDALDTEYKQEKKREEDERVKTKLDVHTKD